VVASIPLAQGLECPCLHALGAAYVNQHVGHIAWGGVLSRRTGYLLLGMFFAVVFLSGTAFIFNSDGATACLTVDWIPHG